MKVFKRGSFIVACVLAFLLMVAYSPSTALAAKADKKAKEVKMDPIDQWTASPMPPLTSIK